MKFLPCSLRALALFVFFFTALTAHAATLEFSAAPTYKVGDTFEVAVLLSSQEAANAVGTSIRYPHNILTLLSISDARSIMNWWPESPHFSQNDGYANLQGVILDPGWKGEGGTVVVLTFQAQTAGQATLSFGADTQILANDGKATNIFTGAAPLFITIEPKPVVPTVPSASPATELNEQPAATSTTSSSLVVPLASTTEHPSSAPSVPAAPLPLLLITSIALLAFLLGYVMGERSVRQQTK